jgi:hypothetical protein
MENNVNPDLVDPIDVENVDSLDLETVKADKELIGYQSNVASNMSAAAYNQEQLMKNVSGVNDINSFGETDDDSEEQTFDASALTKGGYVPDVGAIVSMKMKGDWNTNFSGKPSTPTGPKEKEKEDPQYEVDPNQVDPVTSGASSVVTPTKNNQTGAQVNVSSGPSASSSTVWNY